MERKSFFDEGVFEALRGRISRLTAETKPEWGRMNAAQMRALMAPRWRKLPEASRSLERLGTCGFSVGSSRRWY